MSTGPCFTAAMVQMRTGLMPEPALEQATALIREAAKAGADYVQTPEVSNMMQLNRTALFEHLASEDDDKSLRAYRALAKELNIHLHIGSLALKATPDTRGQPLVPDLDPRARCWRATTRSTCSTSTWTTARAIANRPTTSPARPP